MTFPHFQADSQQDPPARPTRRAAQREATKARILKVARAAFERHGYEATNIRQVAIDAGVATGTVLLHFKDKQDLLLCAFVEEQERTWVEARDSAQHISLEEDLVSFASILFDFYAAHPALARTLLQETLFAPEPWRERFHQQTQALGNHIATLVRAAQQRGVINPTIDSNIFAAVVVSLHRSVLIAWLVDQQTEPLRLFRGMLAQHMYSLVGDNPLAFLNDGLDKKGDKKKLGKRSDKKRKHKKGKKGKETG